MRGREGEWGRGGRHSMGAWEHWGLGETTRRGDTGTRRGIAWGHGSMRAWEKKLMYLSIQVSRYLRIKVTPGTWNPNRRLAFDV